MKNQKKIAQAARLRFEGATFEAIAETLGVGTTTVFRWQKSHLWETITADLDEIQRAETALEFTTFVRSNLGDIKELSVAGLRCSIKALKKTEQLLDSLDILKDFPDPKDRLTALGIMAKCYISMGSGSLEMLSQAAGMDALERDLQETNKKIEELKK